MPITLPGVAVRPRSCLRRLGRYANQVLLGWESGAAFLATWLMLPAPRSVMLALGGVALRLSAHLAVGLYAPARPRGDASALWRVLVATLIGSALLFVGARAVAPLAPFAANLSDSSLFVCLACCLGRWLHGRVLSQPGLQARILVLGTGPRARHIEALQRNTGRFAIDHGPSDWPALPEDLAQYCRHADVREIVVAVDDEDELDSVTRQSLLAAGSAGVTVMALDTFLERETGQLPVQAAPECLIDSTRFRPHLPQAFLVRAVDLLAGTLLLLITLPVMALSLLLIKIFDGWRAPVLYRQQRVGLDGRTFEMWKFRSMSEGAEADGPRWAQEHDPRVTPYGRFMRRTHIDELPQLLNVLLGEMSLVGPRPERPEFVRQLEKRLPYYRARHLVRPGLTGWAQLRYPYGASEEDSMQKLQFDLYYLKHRSVLFDLMILLQTVEMVLWGKGR